MPDIVYKLFRTIPAPEALIEIPIIAAVMYLVLRMLQGTRGAGVLRGLVFLFTILAVLLSLVVSYFQLEQVQFFLSSFLTAPALALMILFQPEVRRGLIRLGHAPLLKGILWHESIVEQVAEAAVQMGKQKIGALIAVQRDVGLDDFIERGTRMDSEVTPELLMTIFWPATPLSDGAVVIANQRLAAAACVLPLSDDPSIDKRLGTRHRAAIGLTEDTCVVVSEETGVISLAVGGQLARGLDKETLAARLRSLLSGQKAPDARGDAR
jgi:diadenylate cyclase